MMYLCHFATFLYEISTKKYLSCSLNNSNYGCPPLVPTPGPHEGTRHWVAKENIIWSCSTLVWYRKLSRQRKSISWYNWGRNWNDNEGCTIIKGAVSWDYTGIKVVSLDRSWWIELTDDINRFLMITYIFFLNSKTLSATGVTDKTHSYNKCE